MSMSVCGVEVKLGLLHTRAKGMSWTKYRKLGSVCRSTCYNNMLFKLLQRMAIRLLSKLMLILLA
uniref:Uncharacterized protein n=1 Tax=Triticum urartu TaxID=4572 RepID=A0A8R7TSS5_TRIUA